MLYDTEIFCGAEVIKLFNDYAKFIFESNFEATQGTGIKI